MKQQTKDNIRFAAYIALYLAAGCAALFLTGLVAKLMFKLVLAGWNVW